ncbi:hypothetical protein [Bacillus sp. FJAT-52991]|uniref:Uncharacterized protein n=1 Tax=Bacillus kandeliae TaxID=3129297 RepID=A0ABZ2N7B1_9BACI
MSESLVAVAGQSKSGRRRLATYGLERSARDKGKRNAEPTCSAATSIRRTSVGRRFFLPQDVWLMTLERLVGEARQHDERR